jgi:transcriptional regulator with XRE-family HTH domain
MTDDDKAGTQRVPEFSLGDRLEKALSVAGVSHREMADYLGVSRNTVGNYIAGRTQVTEGVLRLWSFRTLVPLEWLRGDDQAGRARQRRGPVVMRLVTVV